MIINVLLGCGLYWLHQEHQRLRAQIGIDSLTGLPIWTPSTIRGLLREFVVPMSGIVLVFVDLDDLRLVNNSLGHREGDRLICRAAEALLSGVRRAADKRRVYRRGTASDELVIYLPMPSQHDAQEAVNWLRDALTAEGIRASIGAAWLSLSSLEGRPDPDGLEMSAEAAMRQAKAAGKNQTVWSDL